MAYVVYHDVHYTETGRPEVSCAFQVMDRCNDAFQGDERAACREGARDSHLLSEQKTEYCTSREQAAYDAGSYTTFLDCAPVYEAI